MLSPMLVLYAVAEQCLPLWGNNISPRGRCLLFSQLIRYQRARSKIFFRIFKTLVYLHKVMLSTCFHAMTVSVLSLAKRVIVTRFKKNLRLHHISLIGRFRLSTSSNEVYVAAYDASFEMSNEAIRNRLSRFGVVRSSRRCKLQTMPSIFNGIRILVWRHLNLSSLFLRFQNEPGISQGDTLFAWSTKIRLPSVVSAADLVIKLGRDLIHFCFAIRILFSIFLTFRIFWWEFSSSVFTAVFVAFWSTITQFLEFL